MKEEALLVRIEFRLEEKMHFYSYLKLDCIVNVGQIIHILKNDHKSYVNFVNGNAAYRVTALSCCRR
jgi:hypothetical protein